MRVFISSVIEGFAPYRDAAAAGISAAEATPVRVEDIPSLNTSSRNACLDLIDTCEALAVVVGSRGGWVTPSGRTVTEEEYEYAKSKSKIVLAFVQAGVSRDSDAERLAASVSDYVQGRFRRQFTTPDELQESIRQALLPLVHKTAMAQRAPTDINDALRATRSAHGEVYVRGVFAPAAHVELVDVLELDNRSFIDQLYQVAHRTDVGLFDFEHSKKPASSKRGLEIVEHSPSGIEMARLMITPHGLLIVDRAVSGRSERTWRDASLNHLEIIGEDVKHGTRTVIGAASAVLDVIDPYGRHDPLLTNFGLNGVGHRMWADVRVQKQSYGMRMFDTDDIVSFESPRSITRAELRNPEPLADRVTALFKRHMKDS
jgi:hypothetical protein